MGIFFGNTFFRYFWLRMHLFVYIKEFYSLIFPCKIILSYIQICLFFEIQNKFKNTNSFKILWVWCFFIRNNDSKNKKQLKYEFSSCEGNNHILPYKIHWIIIAIVLFETIDHDLNQRNDAELLGAYLIQFPFNSTTYLENSDI